MKSSGVLASLMLAVALFGAAQATDCTWTAAPVAGDCADTCAVLDTQTEATSASAFTACTLTGGASDPDPSCTTLTDAECTTASATCTNDKGAACGAKAPYTCTDGDGACVVTACVMAGQPVAGDCTSGCGTLTEAVTTAAAGGGTACGTAKTYDCLPGDGACPAV